MLQHSTSTQKTYCQQVRRLVPAQFVHGLIPLGGMSWPLLFGSSSNVKSARSSILTILTAYDMLAIDAGNTRVLVYWTATVLLGIAKLSTMCSTKATFELVYRASSHD